MGGDDVKREQLCLQVWNILDPNEAGMIATLEAICFLCIGCSASLEEKMDFTFKIFDFNNGKSRIELLWISLHVLTLAYLSQEET